MSPAREVPSFEKSSPDLQTAFATALNAFPEAERRKMFGSPAAFANGNLWTSLNQERWVVRLPEHHLDELMQIQGARPFEVMPGREMAGYCVLPQSILDDPDQLHDWLRKSFEHAQGLEPKASKTSPARTSPARKGSASKSSKAKA